LGALEVLAGVLAALKKDTDETVRIEPETSILLHEDEQEVALYTLLMHVPH
jgi:hypothetical protein